MTDTSAWDVTHEYHCAVAAHAREEVVTAAEETVSTAWIAELDRLGRVARAALAGAGAARRSAGDRMRQAQRAAHPRGLAAAQRALDLARAAEHRRGREALELAWFAAEQEESATLAAERRELNAVVHRVRLSAALEALLDLPPAPPRPQPGAAH